MLEFFLKWWWALLAIPFFGFGLLEIILLNLQKLFGFKFPLIGDFLMRRDNESKERIARDDEGFQNIHKRKLGFAFSKRELTTNELLTAQSVFGTKDIDELHKHLANADINLDSNEREKLEKEYLAKNGDSFY